MRRLGYAAVGLAVVAAERAGLRPVLHPTIEQRLVFAIFRHRPFDRVALWMQDEACGSPHCGFRVWSNRLDQVGGWLNAHGLTRQVR